jgi:ribonuclease-3
MSDSASLEETLAISFSSADLLKQALVHSSFTNENPAFGTGHNERLEFLGDAVLDLVVAERIYREFPDVTEGEMTKLRAALVQRDTLARVALGIDLGEFLYLGKGEESSGGRRKPANLAGALEALIAAVYLDQGFSVARDVVIRLLLEEWKKVTGNKTGADFKSRLQEVVQSRFQVTPAYRMVSESGPDHDKNFETEVVAGDSVLGRGIGKSKKSAEMEAARAALISLGADFTK